MRAAWRLLSTFVTVAALGGVAAGAALWRLGLVTPATFGFARAQDTGAEGAPVAAPESLSSGPAADAAQGAPDADRWLWESRLKELRAHIAKERAALDAQRAAINSEKQTVARVTRSLAPLLRDLLGDQTLASFPVAPPPPDAEGRRPVPAKTWDGKDLERMLISDATFVDAAAAALAARAERTRRIATLRSTLAGMRAADAAQLVSEGIGDDLAAEILWGMTEEERTAILQALVEENPQKAGMIFERFAGARAGTRNGEGSKG